MTLEFDVVTGLHPTQKPVDLLEYLIATYSNEKETVLDFCMGSGSTGVAAKNLGRKFIGIERDDEYFEIAKTRLFKGGIGLGVQEELDLEGETSIPLNSDSMPNWRVKNNFAYYRQPLNKTNQ